MVGSPDGASDELGSSVGALETVGVVVGDAVGAVPHSTADLQRMQTSMRPIKTAPVLRLLDMNPLSQTHFGWKMLPFFPIGFA